MDAGYGNNYASMGNQRGMAPDQMDRRPDLVSERPQRWHMLPADSSPYLSASLSPSQNLGSVPNGVRDWQGCRADRGVHNGGQWYYETTVSTDSGVVETRLGWSTNSASLQLGEDAHGFGAGCDPNGKQGHSLHKGQSASYGTPYKNGDIVGAYMDLDSGMVQFSVNGKEQGPAFTLPQEMRGEVFYPASCMRDGSQCAWNFGDDPNNPLRFLPGAPWRPVGQAPGNNTTGNPKAWHLNPHDTSGPGTVISPDQAAAQAQRGFGWQGVRANKGLKGRNGGKFYYEVEPQEAGGLSRVGWTTESGNLEIGRDAEGWGFGADPDGFGLEGHQGKKLHKDEIENYGEPFSKGDVVGCLFDLEHGQMQFCKNGKILGPAYALPVSELNAKAFFPTVCMKDQTLDVNLGQRPFRYPPGEGWAPVCMAEDDSILRSSKTGVMDASQVPTVDQRYDHIKENKPQIQSKPHWGSPDTRTSSHETRHEGPMDDYADDNLAKPMSLPTHPMHPEDSECGGVEYPPHHHHLTHVDPTNREQTFVTQTVEIGEPEEEIVTYTDEHGNKITKKVVKRKQARKVVTNKVVESVGMHGPPCYDPHSGNGDAERSERNLNGVPEVRKETRTTRRNLILSGDGGEEDDLLNEMIYKETGLNKKENVMDENVNDFSMSTLDRKPAKPSHESAV